MGDLFSPSQAGTTKVVNTSDPWKEQIPYLTTGFKEAQKIYNAPGPDYFPNSTIAGPGGTTLAAQDAQAGRAITGSPVNDAAKSQLTGTLNGDYLNNNPYMNAMLDQTFQQIRPQLDSQFAGNSYGSSAHQASIADAYSRAGTQLGYQNYNDERARQLSAVGMAPTIANTDYTDIAALKDVGSAQDAQTQAQLGDQVARWNQQQNKQQSKLDQYMGNIKGNYGGTSTQATPYYTNPGASILGAATGAAGKAAGKPF